MGSLPSATEANLHHPVLCLARLGPPRRPHHRFGPPIRCSDENIQLMTSDRAVDQTTSDAHNCQTRTASIAERAVPHERKVHE